MENLEEMAQKHRDSDGILLSSMAQYKIEESVLSVYNHSSIKIIIHLVYIELSVYLPFYSTEYVFYN